MSRRLISVLVTVFTVMLFATGCNSDQKAVTESVEGFLNAMVANDMEKASQYATEDFMKSDTMKLMQPDYLADTFYTISPTHSIRLWESRRMIWMRKRRTRSTNTLRM